MQQNILFDQSPEMKKINSEKYLIGETRSEVAFNPAISNSHILGIEDARSK
jgi:hypothetical protein